MKIYVYINDVLRDASDAPVLRVFTNSASVWTLKLSTVWLHHLVFVCNLDYETFFAAFDFFWYFFCLCARFISNFCLSFIVQGLPETIRFESFLKSVLFRMLLNLCEIAEFVVFAFAFAGVLGIWKRAQPEINLHRHEFAPFELGPQNVFSAVFVTGPKVQSRNQIKTTFFGIVTSHNIDLCFNVSSSMTVLPFA